MPRAGTRASKESSRLDANAWIEAGLELLSRKGIEAVTLEPLAKSLGVTRGSFYWHFKDRAAFLTAMLAAWRRRATLSVIERIEKAHENPAMRLRKIVDLPFASPRSERVAALELAIRLWAKQDPQAAAAIEEVDEHRLAYIRTLLRGLGCPEAETEERGFLAYGYLLAEAFLGTPKPEDLKARCEAILFGRPVTAPSSTDGSAAPRS